MALRKDANTLTPTERAEFVAAVQAVKAEGLYDQFVLRHANAIMSAIHRAPAFLPWHRRFLYDLELELQRVSGNPNLGIPYWNWPSGEANASMWNDDLLGGDGDASGVVRTGPFRAGEWTVVNASGLPAGPLLRTLGQRASALPTQAEIEQVMAVTPYDVLPWNTSSSPSFRNLLEGWIGPNLHNRGHVWVGGSMLPMTSPNDPVFYMNHCMVDKIWHDWQVAFPNQDYLPQAGGPFGQNLTDPMDSTPSGQIGPRPIDVLDSAALGIIYDDAPNNGDGDQDTIIVVGANPTPADIGSPGETDVFQFEVNEFGPYTMFTTGSSDTFMTLFGPNDPNAQVAVNDDGGENLNSQISLNLSAGTYFLRVRLFSPNTTGDYMVRVRADSNIPNTIPELIVDGASINTTISVRNESDLYRFRITAQDTYTIQTNGTTDTFLTLHGPNNQITEIASNDDGGASLNALIRREIAPGEYFARVRHFSPLGTGPYSIRVSRS